jgi:hypothetical protein
MSARRHWLTLSIQRLDIVGPQWMGQEERVGHVVGGDTWKRSLPSRRADLQVDIRYLIGRCGTGRFSLELTAGIETPNIGRACGS